MKSVILPIKGTCYYQDSHELKTKLTLNQPLFLVEEKHNPYDFNAIQIWGYLKNKSALLGYIPRNKTRLIHFLKNIQSPVKSTLHQIQSHHNLTQLNVRLEYSLSIKQQLYFYWWYILHLFKIKLKRKSS